MSRQAGHRQGGATRGGAEQQDIGRGAEPRHQVVDMPLHAAAELVRDHQQVRLARGAQQCRGDREAGRPGGIAPDMPVDQAGVVGIARHQRIEAAPLPARGGRAEADIALVVHVGVAGQQVAPAAHGGAQAEIILLAVAAAECLAIEHADVVQRRAADVHAEADRGRHLDGAPGVHRAAGGVDRLHVEAEGGRDAGDGGIAADRRVVGKRRDRGDARHRIGLRGKPAQPAVRHHRVAVEQRDIVRRGGLHAAIDRADEAEIARIVQQRDGAGLRQRPQPGDQLRFGRAVFDHDHLARRAVGIGQHGLQAVPRLPQSAIDGDDDVDRDPVRTRRRQHGRGQERGDVERLLGRPAAARADPEVMQHRVVGGFRMHLGVVGGIEMRVRIAQFAGAPGQVVQQRGIAGRRDVGVAGIIPGAVEEAVRIASLVRAIQDVMGQRIMVDRAQLGVPLQIPRDVENRAQPFGCLRIHNLNRR